MATDPDFLVRVRKQLDKVCGVAGRLPTFDDYNQLPLVTACVKEVLRWMPLVVAGW
jgi:cytochrome P450